MKKTLLLIMLLGFTVSIHSQSLDYDGSLGLTFGEYFFGINGEVLPKIGDYRFIISGHVGASDEYNENTPEEFTVIPYSINLGFPVYKGFSALATYSQNSRSYRGFGWGIQYTAYPIYVGNQRINPLMGFIRLRVYGGEAQKNLSYTAPGGSATVTKGHERTVTNLDVGISITF